MTRSRWLPPLIGLATFLIVLVGFGAVAGDAVARNLEMRSLVTSIEKSEAAMGQAQDEVRAVAEKYAGQAPLSADQQAELDAELKAVAARGRDQIASAGDQVASVRWLLWHRDIGAAQRAYLAHNRAWQEYLDRASSDPSEFGRPQDDVNSTFQAAEGKVRAAVPLLALFDLPGRVNAIFAPPPEESGPENGQVALRVS